MTVSVNSDLMQQIQTHPYVRHIKVLHNANWFLSIGQEVVSTTIDSLQQTKDYQIRILWSESGKQVRYNVIVFIHHTPP